MEGLYCSNVDAVNQLMEGRTSININDATAFLMPLVGTKVEALPLRCDSYTWSELENGGLIVYATDVRWVSVVIAVDKNSFQVSEVHVLGK
jgi:hypothetical protein